MKLSGELDYRIRYDVEHDLFHAQNVFNDEYIKPTFIEYVQKLEKENAELKAELEENKDLPAIAYQQGAEWWKKKTEKKLAQAKEIIKEFVCHYNNKTIYVNNVKPLLEQAEQFLKGENIILEDAQVGNSPFDADEVFNKEMKAYPEEK